MRKIAVIIFIGLAGCLQENNKTLSDQLTCKDGKSLLSSWTKTGATPGVVDSSSMSDGLTANLGHWPITCGSDTVTCDFSRIDTVNECDATRSFYAVNCQLNDGTPVTLPSPYGTWTYTKTSSDELTFCETDLACGVPQRCVTGYL